jgi:hypothetical protein
MYPQSGCRTWIANPVLTRGICKTKPFLNAFVTLGRLFAAP